YAREGKPHFSGRPFTRWLTKGRRSARSAADAVVRVVVLDPAVGQRHREAVAEQAATLDGDAGVCAEAVVLDGGVVEGEELRVGAEGLAGPDAAALRGAAVAVRCAVVVADAVVA